jgi:hypothetical protein
MNSAVFSRQPARSDIMRHMIRRTIQLIALGLLLPLWPPGDADAVFEGALRGDYNMTLSRTCAFDTGFGANFERLGGGGDFGVIVQGTITYNGSGGGSFVGQALSINHDSDTIGLFSASPTNQSCTVTYTVNADGTFTQTMNCNLTFTAGPITGNTATLNGITHGGHLSLDGTVLVLSNSTPNVETLTITSGPTIGFTNQRLCNASGTATSRR